MKNIITLIIILAVVSLACFYYRQISEEISLNLGHIAHSLIYHKEKATIQTEIEPIIDKEIVLNVRSAGYYYSPQGDQLGVGPLPPMVDIQTNYWIFWQIGNFNSDLENFTLTAQLPENIVWTDKKSLLAGNLHLGQISRRVVWTVSQINQGGGPYRVGFEIGLIPIENDIDKILDLLTDIQYKAIDKISRKEIQGILDNITTDLIFDSLAANKGKVVPFK